MYVIVCTPDCSFCHYMYRYLSMHKNPNLSKRKRKKIRKRSLYMQCQPNVLFTTYRQKGCQINEFLIRTNGLHRLRFIYCVLGSCFSLLAFVSKNNRKSVDHFICSDKSKIILMWWHYP